MQPWAGLAKTSTSIFTIWAQSRRTRISHSLCVCVCVSAALYHRGHTAAIFPLRWIRSVARKYIINRPYFSRPRKYRRLFSEPTYWSRRSRGQYGEGNNQGGIFEAEGNKSLIPGRLARLPLTCPSTRKVWDESVVSLCSERYNASTGRPSPSGLKWFDRLFSTCNRQLADSPGG